MMRRPGNSCGNVWAKPWRCVALLACAACSAEDERPQVGGRLALGTWGGDNAAVVATDSVTHVHIACTFGDMPANVVLDADGRFTIGGSFVLRAFPVVVGPRLPAQFSGRVTGRTLTLSISVNDTVTKQFVALGPATVVLDRIPNMGPCPICAVPKRMESAPSAGPSPAH